MTEVIFQSILQDIPIQEYELNDDFLNIPDLSLSPKSLFKKIPNPYEKNKDQFCQKEKCLNQPLFNYPSFKKGRMCHLHKEPAMVKIGVYNNCIVKDCFKRAKFNFKNLNPKFCLDHKGPKMFDVVTNRCQFYDCSIKASFNYKEMRKPKFCTRHKLDRMVDVKHPHCQIPDCYRRAYFNFKESEKGEFCRSHKKEGMIRMRKKNPDFCQKNSKI